MTAAVTVSPARHRPRTEFVLPPGHEATSTPEERGLARDQVRLLVARPGQVALSRFHRLAAFLAPGDLVVVNTSATLPAALDGVLDGRPVGVHVCAAPALGAAAGRGVGRGVDWVVELRRTDGTGPVLDVAVGARVGLPGGAALVVGDGYPAASVRVGSRLHRADWSLGGAAGCVPGLLHRFGRPISYGYLGGRPSLLAYQNVFADEPGSAELASAGRPFSGRVLAGLASRGVAVAPIVLHAGVSSPEAGEPPLPEWFRVPSATARAVNQTRASGGRVVAVGTTVVRALESASRPGGQVVNEQGWTGLVLGPDRPARVVDGLVTGWHEPGASHLLLLEAVAGPALVAQAYRAALREHLLWHEFGDSCLLLPGRTIRPTAA